VCVCVCVCVCVSCDRFICVCGTEDLFWIKKTMLIQHKSRLNLENINKELSSCYQVKDPELKDLILSPWARFKPNDCCSQCFTCWAKIHQSLLLQIILPLALYHQGLQIFWQKYQVNFYLSLDLMHKNCLIEEGLIK
jgi:hypothetical protein